MNSLGIIIALGGGLGLFLYGMKLMSDSLEKVAGARLRSVLEVLTKNKFAGILVGVIFTAIVQSSSATTVMVVSFVNAGLMNLFQAVGVIYGANIGTTVTSQLVSFNLSEYAPIFVLVGVIMYMFMKKPAVKKFGEVIIGFGILFIGLSTMSASMESLKSSPMVTDLLGSLTNPFLGILMGFVITAILQSSSVTVSIVLLMAVQGLLALSICFYIILGCNMGSCVSALIASLSGKKDAKRAALIHFIFNVMGTAVLALILLVAGDYVEQFICWISGDDIGRCVANAHTIFKVFEVIILLPASSFIVKLTYKLVKGEDRKAQRVELKYIGEHYILTPATAVPQVVREINRMGKIATENLDLAVDALLSGNEAEMEKVFEVEKTIDFLNHEITQYLVRANQLSLPVDDRKLLGALFHVVSDIERVGDHAENIAEDAKAKKTLKLSFSEDGDRELREMVNMVNKILSLSLEMFSNNTKAHLDEILLLEDQIDRKERALQNSHIERLNKNICTAQEGMMFSDLASNLERVADHATNIAFSILEEDPEGDKEPKEQFETGV